MAHTNDTISQLTGRFAALPRAMKWGVGAVAFLVVYFGIIEPVIKWQSNLSVEALAAESELESVRQRAEGRETEVRQLEESVVRHGRVELGEDAGAWSVELNNAIDSILEGKPIQNLTRSARTEALRRGDLTAQLDAGREVVRQIVELQFETDPATAVRVLSELERSPKILAVGRVNMQEVSGGSGNVRVTLEPEGWSQARRGTRR